MRRRRPEAVPRGTRWHRGGFPRKPRRPIIRVDFAEQVIAYLRGHTFGLESGALPAGLPDDPWRMDGHMQPDDHKAISDAWTRGLADAWADRDGGEPV